MGDTQDRGLSDEELQAVSGGTQESLTGKLETMGELSEQDQLNLQMRMEQMTKSNSMASNILKKVSDTAAQITQNLK